jgi:hypothetical protein
MADLKFNVETSDVSKAVGFSKEELDAFGAKMAEQCITFLQGNTSPGGIAEWLHNNLSQQELIFCATRNTLDSILDGLKEARKDNKKVKEKKVNYISDKELVKALKKVKSSSDFNDFLVELSKTSGLRPVKGSRLIVSRGKPSECCGNMSEGMPSDMPKGFLDFLTSLKAKVKDIKEKINQEEQSETDTKEEDKESPVAEETSEDIKEAPVAE